MCSFFYLQISLLVCIPFCPNTDAQSFTNDFQSSTRLLLSDAEFDDSSIITKIKTISIYNKNQTKSIKPASNSPKNQTKNQTKLIKPSSNLPKNQTKWVKPVSSFPKNQTKLVKSASSLPKNQTKLVKSASSLPKNQTNPIKLTSESAKNKTKVIKPNKETPSPIKMQLKKLNLTKPTSNPIKKPSDLTKSSPPKIKTTKTDPTSKNPDKIQPQKQKTHNFIDQEDLVNEFRDLPSRFQQTLLPDLEKISITSKDYLTRYNKQITKGFKPYVGTKYAPTIASFVSFAFIIIPLILVSLLFNRIKSYFSLQKVLIFIQVYLCIYFYILCLSSLVTGLEPLKFFYSVSRSTYICVQVLQTLGYVLYLLMLLMYLVLVFSNETGPGSKLVGLAQTFVGFAVGLHYYVTVFHRVVLRQPPKTSWRVHGIYATCYLVICLLATADRRKKAYLEEGGEEGKKS